MIGFDWREKTYSGCKGTLRKSKIETREKKEKENANVGSVLGIAY